jgi:hypothetical protein
MLDDEVANPDRCGVYTKCHCAVADDHLVPTPWRSWPLARSDLCIADNDASIALLNPTNEFGRLVSAHHGHDGQVEMHPVRRWTSQQDHRAGLPNVIGDIETEAAH